MTLTTAPCWYGVFVLPTEAQDGHSFIDANSLMSVGSVFALHFSLTLFNDRFICWILVLLSGFVFTLYSHLASHCEIHPDQW